MIQELKTRIAEAFKSLYQAEVNTADVKLEQTNKEFEGDFTFVVFQYLKLSRQKPEDTAQALGQFVSEKDERIASFNVVKGFLNFTLSASYWTQFLENVFSKKLPDIPAVQPRSIMVEYSSPNTNKPLHLGHVRNNLLGFSISQILSYVGHTVQKVNLINDRGIHICKSMLAYKMFGNDETPEAAEMKGDHLVGKYYVMFDQVYKEEIKSLMAEGKTEDEAKAASELMRQAREMLLQWEEHHEQTRALWEKMNGWVYKGFEQTYGRMGVSFDNYYYESQTYLLGKEMVIAGCDAGVFYRKEDQSIWVDLTDDGLDHKLLLRPDGTSVYITQDIGTAHKKYEDFKSDDSIYVVGNEQDYHFKVLKLIMQKLGEPGAEGIQHMSYGMVELPDGKLKTREGKVVDADNLMDEMNATAKERTEEQGKTEGMEQEELKALYETLGMGALKYFLLKVDPAKRILFNPSDSIDFQGNTGTFIQYTYARCKSILNVRTPENSGSYSLELEPSERELIVHFHDFGDKMVEAAAGLSPAVVTAYLYETAKAYNSFYNQCTILKADDEEQVNFRLILTAVAANIMKQCAELLGMQMPERM
ncbi:MAG: arginyl-tRNA synthetase [Bacteroidia bacterium]|jgi:arginyl-tRNA synthetase